MALPVKVNYLTNKELLAEIHKSKCSYSHFVDHKFKAHDAIVRDLAHITPELIQATRELKAKRQLQAEKQKAKDSGLKNHQIKIDPIDPLSIPIEDIVWRLMTFEHIPLDPERVKKPKSIADNHTKLLFPPFKHFVLENGEPREVGRSHWKDALDNGQFCQNHGTISKRLALMFMKLVERYSQRGNWRGYTYIDEMRSQALLQLSQVGLQFDESRGENPFAYFTVTVSNAFTRILNLEKKNQNIRDDLLIMHGVTPSMTRQIDNSLAQRALMNGEVAPAKKPGRRGPPPKVRPMLEAD